MTIMPNAVELLTRIKNEMGPEPLELMLETAGEAAPALKQWPPERVFQYIRCRLEFTQSELALKAGLTQSQVSRIESGADCLFSTWLRAYAAMGFELRLMPASDMKLEELAKCAEAGRPHGHWLRQRARPRRLWRDGAMISFSEWKEKRDPTALRP